MPVVLQDDLLKCNGVQEINSRRCRKCTTIDGESPVCEIVLSPRYILSTMRHDLNLVGIWGDHALRLNINTYR